MPDQFGVVCTPAQIAGVDPFLASKDGFDPGNGPLLNAAAFEAPDQFNFYAGSGPRVTNLRGPGYKNEDVTFSKNFAITERVSFQLRADFFNIFNLHSLRNNFDTDIASPSFGTWNGGVSGPRTIQIGGRIDF